MGEEPEKVMEASPKYQRITSKKLCFILCVARRVEGDLPFQPESRQGSYFGRESQEVPPSRPFVQAVQARQLHVVGDRATSYKSKLPLEEIIILPLSKTQ